MHYSRGTTMKHALGSIALTAAAAALFTPCAAAGGRIVVANDEWTLSNQGFASAANPTQFVENVADWFTGGAAGHFLVRSGDFGLTGTSLASAMTSAGHTK